MDKKLDLNVFFKLYNNSLLPKEDILKQLNITEYFYKKIIKEYKLKRQRTSEFNRIKKENIDFFVPLSNDITIENNKNTNIKSVNINRTTPLPITKHNKDGIKNEEDYNDNDKAKDLLKEVMKSSEKTLNRVKVLKNK